MRALQFLLSIKKCRFNSIYCEKNHLSDPPHSYWGSGWGRRTKSRRLDQKSV